MLVRLVTMTFRPDAVEAFRGVFAEAHPQIEAFEGCRGVDLWSDVKYPNILMTHSRWESAAHLAAYRESDLFKTTWAKTKVLFAAPPTAQSVEETVKSEKL